MNSKFTRVVCLLSWAVVLSVTHQASAQTTANGPYYAYPAWDQTLACTTLATCPRFIVLSNMNSAAVLDRETGLVWEKSPSASQFTWSDAIGVCNATPIGGRLGWRLPTMQELASLVEVTNVGITLLGSLPPGHPFRNVQSSFYWSATTRNLAPSPVTAAWGVGFGNSNVGIFSKEAISNFVWCVRGGQGVDPQ